MYLSEFIDVFVSISEVGWVTSKDDEERAIVLTRLHLKKCQVPKVENGTSWRHHLRKPILVQFLMSLATSWLWRKTILAAI